MKTLEDCNIDTELLKKYFDIFHTIKKSEYVTCLDCNKEIANVGFAKTRHFRTYHNKENGEVSVPHIKQTIKIKLKFKDGYKNNKKAPFRGGMPYTPSQKEYFLYYLGKEEGMALYNERKKLFLQTILILWYTTEFKDFISEADLKLIRAKRENTRNKLKQHSKFINSQGWYKEKQRAGLKKTLNSKEHKEKMLQPEYIERAKKQRLNQSATLKANWKDKGWRNKILEKRKNSGMYEKSSKTFKNKFANDTNFRLEFKARMNKPSRIKKVSENSKKWWANLKKDPEKFKKRLSLFTNGLQNKIIRDNGYKMNNVEYEFSKLLDKHNLKYRYEEFFNFEKRSILPDFHLPDHNNIIEIFGDYWHANPIEFKSNDRIFKNMYAHTIWKKDKEKKQLFEAANYKYRVVWESEIWNNIEEVERKLLCWLRKN